MQSTDLAPDEQECFRQLFFHGPTWDGDIVSKAGRAGLVDRGYVERENGWSQLTSAGFVLAVRSGLGDEKERWANARRKVTNDREQKVERAYGLLWNAKTDRDTFTGLAVSDARKIIIGLVDKEGQARGIEWANAHLQSEMYPVRIVTDEG